MPNLYQLTAKKEQIENGFTNGEITALAYHDIFDYPLTISEMIKWKASDAIIVGNQKSIIGKDGYYLLEGKEGTIYKRTLRKRISERKMAEAKKAAKLLSMIPQIQMVAVTGSLAMQNSSEEGDIDLMIVSSKGKLWTTRLISQLMLRFFGFKVRNAGDKNQKDKLCLNIWIDESDLAWREGRNIYTAHEIAQVIPLINKNKAYERFISENKWVRNFWPNAIKVLKFNKTFKRQTNFGIMESILYKMQYLHMRSKITREKITRTKALFHPQDWSKVVLSRFPLDMNFKKT